MDLDNIRPTVQEIVQWTGWLILLFSVALKGLAWAIRTPRLVDTRLGQYFERRKEQRRLDDAIVRLAGSEQKIEKLIATFSPNGGKTFYDQVQSAVNGIVGLKKELSETNGLLIGMMSSSRDALWKRDADGRMVWVNRAYEELVGHTLDDISGYNWKNIVHPDDRKFVIESWEDARRDGRNFEVTYRATRDDGSVVQVQSFGYPILDEDKTPIGYAGNLQPVPPRVHLTNGKSELYRVLCVDDGKDFLEIMRSSFAISAPSIEFFSTPTAGDAVQQYVGSLISGHPYGVVLLDYMMPHTNGREVAQAIRHHERLYGKHRARIAFVTGAPEEISKNDVSELEIARVFAKPVDPSDLLEWVKTGL